MQIYMYQGQCHSLIFDEGPSERNWISGERYRTNGPLVREAAEFPKLFCDRTPKVSNSMYRGKIWENYSLQRILNAFRSSNYQYRLYYVKTINDLGCV